MNQPDESTEKIAVEQPDAWDQLEQIVAAGDPDAAHKFLKELPPGEDARIMAQLSEAEQHEFIALLDDENAAWLMESLPELQAGQLLSSLPPE
ncbi:MAG: magnesium transporter, partial [Planctomycetaceae bacterium]|nr:magnesium transporter [Planctomycetaceae bacterium]